MTELKIPTPVEEMAKRGLIPAAITSYRIPRHTDGVDDGEITFGLVHAVVIAGQHADLPLTGAWTKADSTRVLWLL